MAAPRPDPVSRVIGRRRDARAELLRGLPGPVRALCIGAFINRLGGFVIVFVVPYVVSLGYTAGQAGLALGAYGAGTMCAGLAGGWLTDRIGARSTIVGSMFIGAAVLLGMSLARSVASITLLAAAAGLTTEAYRPAAYVMLGSLVEPAERVRAMAVYRTASNVGFAAGGAAAGALATISFAWIFVADAASCALFGVVALRALPPVGRARGRPHGMFTALRTDRTLRIFLLANLMATIVFFQQTTTLPLHINDAGLSLGLFGALMSLNGILIIVFQVPLSGRIQRLRIPSAIAIGFLLYGIGFMATAWATTALALALTVTIWTFGEMASSPGTVVFAQQLAPPDLRGRYQGLQSLTWAAGMALGPPIGAVVYTVSPSLVWGGAGVVGALAAAVVVRLPDRGALPRTSA